MVCRQSSTSCLTHLIVISQCLVKENGSNDIWDRLKFLPQLGYINLETIRRKTAAFLTYLNISTTCKTLSLLGKQNIVYLGLLLKCSISVCAFLPSFFHVQRYSPERLAWHVMTHAFLLLKENKHLQDNKASQYQKRIQYKQKKMQHMILGTIQTLDRLSLAGFSLVPCLDICGRAHWPCFIRSPSTGWAQTKHSRPLVGACMLFLVEEICRHCLHRRVYKGWESLRTGIHKKKKLTGSLVKTRETPSRKCSQTGFKKNKTVRR